MTIGEFGIGPAVQMILTSSALMSPRRISDRCDPVVKPVSGVPPLALIIAESTCPLTSAIVASVAPPASIDFEKCVSGSMPSPRIFFRG